MGFFGSAIGGMLGKIGSKILPLPGVDGEKFGNYLGGLAPFKKGGRVRKVKINKPRKGKSKSRRKK